MGDRKAEDGRLQSTAAGIKELVALPQLKGLSLQGATIGNQALRPMREMQEQQELTLRQAKVVDAGMRQLAGTPQLRELIPQETPITGNGLQHLANANLSKP